MLPLSSRWCNQRQRKKGDGTELPLAAATS